MITNRNADKIRSYLSEQDKLIFDFSIATGLRISDVLNLKANRIDKVINIRERKTRKLRVIDVPDELYARIKHLKTNNAHVYAFCSPRDTYKPLHRSTFNLHLAKACKAIGVNCSPHSTRKLYAMNLFKKSEDIFAVQKALNHKYITTTCGYLDINLVKLLKDHADQIKFDKPAICRINKKKSEE